MICAHAVAVCLGILVILPVELVYNSFSFGTLYVYKRDRVVDASFYFLLADISE